MDEVLDLTVMSHFCCLQSKLLYVFITEGTSKNLKKKSAAAILSETKQKIKRRRNSVAVEMYSIFITSENE